MSAWFTATPYAIPPRCASTSVRNELVRCLVSSATRTQPRPILTLLRMMDSLLTMLWLPCSLEPETPGQSDHREPPHWRLSCVWTLPPDATLEKRDRKPLEPFGQGNHLSTVCAPCVRPSTPLYPAERGF